MTRTHRPRHLSAIALTAVFALLLAACSGQYPNSTFTDLTDFNRDARGLWNLMIWLGIGVFVFVEGLLVYVMFRYRRRPNDPSRNMCTATPSSSWRGPSCRRSCWRSSPSRPSSSIWKFQSGAPANALQVDVIGHQWWWEFRYPEQNIVTANELYIPTGRPVNFVLRSADVIHSFWIPQLGGKRDVVSNRTNTLWFTPDSVGTQAFNGSCNEYCGASHANMRFRAYTVSPEEFESVGRGTAGHCDLPARPAAAPAAAPAPGGAADCHAGRGPGTATGTGRRMGVPEGEPAGARDSEDANPRGPYDRRRRAGRRRCAAWFPGVQPECLHRLPSRPRQSCFAGRHRAGTDAPRVASHDRRRALPE